MEHMEHMENMEHMEHDMLTESQRFHIFHRDAAGTDSFTDFAAEPVTEWAGQVLGGRPSCPSGPSTNKNSNDWQH